MRSLLFVPGNDTRKLQKAMGSGADTLIIDLEDSVAYGDKVEARQTCLDFLQDARSAEDRPALYVRINGLDTGLSDGDLDVVMTAAPDGIVLPKSAGGPDISLLDARLAVREALHDLPDGQTRILAIATESANALFGLGTYSGASHRLAGLAWGAEDLATDLGAGANKSETGAWTSPFMMARNLCLFGAIAAEIQPVDTVFTDFRDLDGLRKEAEVACSDGFTGKLAIHPAQVPVINAVFTPSEQNLKDARRIIKAFEAAGNPGVVSLDGKMVDRPHLVAAKRLLARVAGSD